MTSMTRRWLGCTFLAWFLGGAFALLSADDSLAATVLRVAAASDLRPVGAAWVSQFNRLNPDVRVEVIYGSSGKLARQIAQGAPFDLFFSADERYPAQLAVDGHAMGSPRRYAKGRLVLWWPRDDRISWQALRMADVRHIAIAHPDHAPYGHRALQAIQMQPDAEELINKLVRGENVAQATQYVISGAADAGLVARSLMTDTSGGQFVLIDEAMHEPLWQSAMVVVQASDPAAAQQFLSIAFSAEGQATLTKYGFDLP